MDERSFKRLIKKDRYQVFLFTSPCSIPINFFPHYWFVCNNKGKISRWEVLNRKNKKNKTYGHLYKNFFPPTRGLEIIYGFKKYSWNSALVASIEGDKNSPARKICSFLNRCPKNYPYSKEYNLVLGPNSNTFIQYVIDAFPDAGFKLSGLAVGKKYKKLFG